MNKFMRHFMRSFWKNIANKKIQADAKFGN